MFDIKNILYNSDRRQYLCGYFCNSPDEAQTVVANNIHLSRILSMSGEMFSDGNIAYIGAGTANDVRNIAVGINANYFMSPLDVYVFYGNSQKNLEGRWCVGFDFPDSTRLIDFLNRQGQMIMAYSDPQNWFDKKGKSYSVVMHTGVTEHHPAEETAKLLNQRVNSCLDAIFNVTFRKLNAITIQ